MSTGRKANSGTSTSDGFSLTSAIRSFGDEPETGRPYEPLLGGPRLFILLLYASVIVVVSIQYFAGEDMWPGAWDIYNTYVLVVTGVFVFLGMLMLFSSERKAKDEYTLPVPRILIATLGFVMLTLSGIGLVYWGDSLGGWAIVLSVILLYGFLLMLLGGRGFETKEVARLSIYATGLIIMILVPVHNSFGYYQDSEHFPFTLLDLVLLTVGMVLALVAVQSLQTRDGFIGAWLMGAMAIFLIAFHEQIGIVASGNYSQYDRMLAFIGISFSFLPLALYFWRERVYFFLWRRLGAASSLMDSGDYEEALKQADAALKQCAKVGIEDRFALPWSVKADILYRMRQYQKAAIFYETALKIDPKDSTSWSHLGNIYALEGNHEAALKTYNEALKADPRNGYAWNNKGAVYQQLAMNQDALICFDKAVDYMPDKYDPHMNMAKLFSKMGHSSDALRHYQEALAIRPESKIASEGVKREFFRSMCVEQITGWEQMGLDTAYLKRILDEDPAHFVLRSKEFIASIVEQKGPISLAPGMEHVDVQKAMQQILTITGGGANESGNELARCPKCDGLVSVKDMMCPNCGAEFESEYEPSGATLEQIEEVTGLSKRELVLPLALLMETDRLHFKSVGRKQVYVSAGKAPEEPPPIPPPVAPSPPPPPPPPPPEPKPELQKVTEPPAPVLSPKGLFRKAGAEKEKEAAEPQRAKPVEKPKPAPKEKAAEKPEVVPEEKPKGKPKEKPKAPPEPVADLELERALVEEPRPKKMREVVTVEPTASILVFTRRVEKKPAPKSEPRPAPKPAKKKKK